MSKLDAQIIEWLMQGDPAVRWQVQRDLLGEKPTVYEKERAKVARQGWGARYLSLQDKAGVWDKGIYTPKWTSTHYTMWSLYFLGLSADNKQARKSCMLLLKEGFRPDHGIDYSGEQAFKRRAGKEHALRGRGETCITGMALAIFSHFEIDDERVDLIAEHLLRVQMADHGWNCRWHRGDTHSSFNTTWMALHGLSAYKRFRPKTKLPIEKAAAQGREFLLQHQLYRSHTSGQVISARFKRMPVQFSWQYDFLRGLDLFQAAGAKQDERLQDPIALLESKRSNDGVWLADSQSGKVFFTLEKPGTPSRWNTLRALRILKWWNN